MKELKVGIQIEVFHENFNEIRAVARQYGTKLCTKYSSVSLLQPPLFSQC